LSINIFSNFSLGERSERTIPTLPSQSNEETIAHRRHKRRHKRNEQQQDQEQQDQNHLTNNNQQHHDTFDEQNDFLLQHNLCTGNPDSDSERQSQHISLFNDNEQLCTVTPEPFVSPQFHGLFELITENLDQFVRQPAPNGLGDIHCQIKRDKHGVEKGLSPTYYMHVERDGGRKFSILAGRKRWKSRTSNYLISTDATDLSRDAETYIGKLKSNMMGTQFTIYEQVAHSKYDMPIEKRPHELGVVCY
ncbi:unnamed protein product, partial [Didymodactylos carnosus]